MNTPAPLNPHPPENMHLETEQSTNRLAYNYAYSTLARLAEKRRMTEEQHERAVDRLDRVFMRDDCTPESLANVAAYYSSLYA
jgi:hypothetical protein